eukprot:TRINITY_DN4463_c0_g1_i6.p1 TRINITY_DN4463_c0_g1~~TRINITY_DN4463_c0_g1_i6.p1  ORF type:complete len:208 (-),score=35.23 TRINITY_DN4463_c0_g1_i6:80-619(-)
MKRDKELEETPKMNNSPLKSRKVEDKTETVSLPYIKRVEAKKCKAPYLPPNYSIKYNSGTLSINYKMPKETESQVVDRPHKNLFKMPINLLDREMNAWRQRFKSNERELLKSKARIVLPNSIKRVLKFDASVCTKLRDEFTLKKQLRECIKVRMNRKHDKISKGTNNTCLLYTSPSPRD